MNAGRWMLHLDLTCGSVEYAGGEPPAEALARVVGVLGAHGLLRGPGAAADGDRDKLKPETWNLEPKEGETA